MGRELRLLFALCVMKIYVCFFGFFFFYARLWFQSTSVLLFGFLKDQRNFIFVMKNGMFAVVIPSA